MSTTEQQALESVSISEVTAPPPGWETAVKCRERGDSDIVAIQAVYDVLPPPAYLSTVATIVGSIYADTYWSTTRLDPAILSASLQKAGGWAKPDCDRAAGEAFAKWSGVLTRANFSDVGFIPRPGSLTDSPDVLANADGPLSPSLMLRQWNSRFYDAAPGRKNYVYARAQTVNLPVPVSSASVRMFHTDAGFNQPPSTWQILYTFEGDIQVPLQGMVEGPIEPGGRAAASRAFNFEPPAAGHYCLIAVASTEFFQNDPLASTGNWNSAEWIARNGAAGWHNLDVPQAERSVLRFYNQDDRPERFAFEVTASKVPEGTRIELSSPEVELGAAPVSVAGSHHRVRTPEVSLPANFAGELGVTIRTPDGSPLPVDASVEVGMVWVLPAGHERHGDALVRLPAAAARAEAVEVPMGSFTFVGSIE